MRELLKQIEAALDANLYYLALFASLVLPDICGVIDSPADKVGARYMAWFNKYVAPKYLWNGYPYLTGADCYYFRCSLLHQGSAQIPEGSAEIPRSNYSRVIFIEPLEDELTPHLNLIDDALNVDLHIFCNDIVRSVREWLDKVENTQEYKDNYDKFMRRYPQGLPEHGINRPVIM